MNCSPLIERELRLAIRRPGGGYGLRLLCAWAATALSFVMLFIWSSLRPGVGFGRSLLQVLAVGGYIGVMLGGMVLTADAISRERREGTLELLLLTDLRIEDVILGKLIAKMILPLYGILAVVPMLEISVLIGGTTAGECVRLALILANALFFALVSSLWVSSACLEQRNAYAGTVLTILSVSVGIPMLGWTLWDRTGNPAWFSGLLLLSPTGPYWFANDYSSSRGWFWAALSSNQALAWGLIGWTRAALMRRAAATVPLRAETNEPIATAVSSGQPNQKRLRLLKLNPIRWLAWRSSGTPWALWLCAAGSIPLVLLFKVNPFGTVTEQIAMILLALAHLIVKAGIATDAVHAFAVDKRSGALESLLGTRLSVAEITAGMLKESSRQFALPLLLLFVATATAAFQLFRADFLVSGMVLLGTAILLPLDSYCLAWVGLLQGLAARNAAAGLGSALFQVVLMPWAWLLIAKAFMWRSSTPELLIIWGVFAVINQWFALSGARTRLFDHFRTLALKPYGAKNPAMESAWSPINWEEEGNAEQIPDVG